MAIRPTVKVTSNTKRFQEFAEKLKAAANKHVKIGILGKNTERGETLTNVQLGVIHEFGTSTIPARPHVKPTMQEGKRRYGKLLQSRFKQSLDADKSLGITGAVIVGDIKKRIRDGIPPPNSPKTVARKGSSTPLIDTGQYINSITWEVGEDH